MKPRFSGLFIWGGPSKRGRGRSIQKGRGGKAQKASAPLPALLTAPGQGPLFSAGPALGGGEPGGGRRCGKPPLDKPGQTAYNEQQIKQGNRRTRVSRSGSAPARELRRGGTAAANTGLNGLVRAARTAGGPVACDGGPTRYPGKHMVVCAEWAPQGVKLGGTAEAAAFVPVIGTRAVFLLAFGRKTPADGGREGRSMAERAAGKGRRQGAGFGSSRKRRWRPGLGKEEKN